MEKSTIVYVRGTNGPHNHRGTRWPFVYAILIDRIVIAPIFRLLDPCCLPFLNHQRWTPRIPRSVRLTACHHNLIVASGRWVGGWVVSGDGKGGP